MNRCVCCYSPATKVVQGYYHCDMCYEDWQIFQDYYLDGYPRTQAVSMSGYLDMVYTDKPECKDEDWEFHCL